MPFEIIPHTADVRMRCSGKSREEFFRDALLGMVSIIKPHGGQKNEKITRTIVIGATDITALLVDFLNEALAWMHTKREAYTGVHIRNITECTLEAELVGYTAVAFGEDIKAATYHEVDVAENPQGVWSATVIFDI